MNAYQYVTSRVYLERKLTSCLGKTLGECDTARVFDKALANPRIKGIAGDVVEQSIVGYPANSDQAPDLYVDGQEIELKTTGLRHSKKGKGLEAKEPMSITAVSLEKISSEDFEHSNFWHKVRSMLIVYYLYASETAVKALDYADFPIKGYQFHEFTEEEMQTLRSDWQLVHDFVTDIQTRCSTDEERKAEYPKLSSALRDKLMLIDTSPKYPNPPRFRLKRTTVTAIARKNFGEGYMQLPKSYTSYASIDLKLHEIAKQYRGKKLGKIARELDISYDPKKQNKNLAEQFVVRAFGARGKMSDIELFAKIGLKPKTITLTATGARTEDMKLFTIDFEEFAPEATFDDSLFLEYFANNQLLCMVFEEPSADAPLTENVFLGFKRMAFDDEFIEGEVKRIWNRIKHLITEDKLVDVVSYSKETGKPIINKTGVVKSAPNFPKSKENAVFVRGTSSDSTHKPECVNGVRMYRQQVWVKGSYAAMRMEKADWI